MGAKDKSKQSNHSSDEEDYDPAEEDEEMDIQEEVEKKIKELPTLKQKVQAIAINHYILQKRKIDEQLQREIEQLEQKFRSRFNPFTDQINKIISGEYDYTNADFQDVNEILTGEELASKDHYTSKKDKLPEYWLKAMLTSDVLAEQVQQIDEPLLKHLQKIQAQKTEDLKRFSVYFYFSENEWFSNTKIAKHFDIEQTEIKKSHGDQVNWKEGKNITVKNVKKKGKKGAKKTKEVKQPSFFNLFKEIEMNSDEQDNEEESQPEEQDEVEELELQYEMCEHIYEELIPKSLEYFLGIAPSCGDCCGEEGCEEGTCAIKGAPHSKANDDQDDQ